MDIYFVMLYKYLLACCIKRLTVQLEYLERLVVSTNLIKPGRIRVTSGSDPDYYPGQWVIRVSGGDPVSTLTCSIQPTGVVTMAMKVLHNTRSMCIRDFPDINSQASGIHIR